MAARVNPSLIYLYLFVMDIFLSCIYQHTREDEDRNLTFIMGIQKAFHFNHAQ